MLGQVDQQAIKLLDVPRAKIVLFHGLGLHA